MTITNLRLVNGICIAFVALCGTLAAIPPLEKRLGTPGLYVFGLALVGLIYLLASLLEPSWIRWLNRKGGRPERLPFEVVLMQHQFGLELREILYFEKGIKRPAFSSGNPLSPRRIYLHRGVEDKLNSRQLQGLFAVQLAALALERDTKLWASGGAVFLSLFSILLIMSRMLPGVTVPSQLLLAVIPALIYLLDLLFMPLSRHLVYLSDRLAARVLVYPDCLLSYLEALAMLERGAGEDGDSDYWEKGKSGLKKRSSFASPYPLATERLKRLGKAYPGAEAIARKLIEKAGEEGPAKKGGDGVSMTAQERGSGGGRGRKGLRFLRGRRGR